MSIVETLSLALLSPFGGSSIRRNRYASSEVKSRAELLDESCGIGLWEAVLVDADAMHPKSRWTWSPEFRRLVGYETEVEFPNVVHSWSDRLHPDDVEATFAAFGGHLEDVTGKARYDVTYRLKVKDGSYRWFRATGGCKHLSNGIIRACGSLSDIHDARTLRNNIDSAVAALDNGLQHLAAGNLHCEIHTPFAGSLDEIRRNFNDTSRKLNTTFAEIRHKTDGIMSTITSLDSAANDLAKRTETQAHSISSASSNAEGIANTAKKCHDTSENTKDFSIKTKQEIVASSDIVDESVEAMTEIKKFSEEISNITSMIDNISFQTNLLALNAGVEAARAGSAGAGFAVVAQEVRQLAGRSTEAAHDIKTLIEKSRNAVDRGVALVGNTGSAMATFTGSIERISDEVQQVAVYNEEQSTGIDAMSQSMSAIEADIQRNAAMAEETSAATRDLAADAKHLMAQLDQFKLNADGAQAHSGQPLKMIA